MQSCDADLYGCYSVHNFTSNENIAVVVSDSVYMERGEFVKR